MEFDLNAIWTTAGASATVLLIGYIWGFLQSVVPWIPTTGAVRNIVLTAITLGLVILAGIATGKTLDNPNLIGDVFTGFIVFLGLQRMALSAADAGNTSAQVTVPSMASPIAVSPPDATVEVPATPSPPRPPAG